MSVCGLPLLGSSCLNPNSHLEMLNIHTPPRDSPEHLPGAGELVAFLRMKLVRGRRLVQWFSRCLGHPHLILEYLSLHFTPNSNFLIMHA